MFMSLYKSIVKPHLEYASCKWAPVYKRDCIALENVQRRATKMVPCLRNLPYSERLKKIGSTLVGISPKKSRCYPSIQNFT